MNSQEREIISEIFKRLEQAAGQPRDPETERLINDKIRSQPYAPYAMAQLIYVQEEAIKSLNQQLEQMRAEVERARSQPQSGGFLSSIFGGGSRPQPEPQRPAGSPWGGQPQPGPGYGQGYGPGGPQPGMMGGGGGGGFLRGALTTAAGVAGGMVVGNALMNAFRGGHESLGGFSAADASTLTGGQSDLSGLSPFQDAAGAAGFGPDAGGGFDGGGLDSGGFQDADFDAGGDGGDFGGGGDDWT